MKHEEVDPVEFNRACRESAGMKEPEPLWTADYKLSFLGEAEKHGAVGDIPAGADVSSCYSNGIAVY